ncbi:MFS transporter [Spongiactinospora sp. TRM90649]|uniref:MFS transporter n=1 Tax=Spongiactinospora sp. TRM90649 TaxID=3031114 RepID=UPI0023F7031B|nr:MFS transporter [Spongiactinospora sp. TRM90649]MDF5757083.1 MFS transporter [Spongiactinospora sp. TRM90649]
MLYPVYSLLFGQTGLSAAQISTLFVIWSLASFALEVPSGLLADVVSRKLLIVAAPLVTGAGYALWTFQPGYLAFAAGFMLWGMGGALRSGAWEALVYEELARVGASASYARVIGRSKALGGTASLVASLLASPVLAMGGGYLALGVASVAVCVLCALVALTLPETRGGPGGGDDDEEEAEGGFLAVLRDGLAEVRGAPRLRTVLVVVALLTGVTAIDEYLPMLAEGTGIALAAVPLLVLLTDVGAVVGGWLAGRGVRRLVPVLALGAVCLAAGAAAGTPGFVLVGVAFGVFHWSMAAADARLQERVRDRSRATVTSMAGFGAEVVAVLVFGLYGLASAWARPWEIFLVAAVAYLPIALALRRTR